MCSGRIGVTTPDTTCSSSTLHLKCLESSFVSLSLSLFLSLLRLFFNGVSNLKMVSDENQSHAETYFFKVSSCP